MELYDIGMGRTARWGRTPKIQQKAEKTAQNAMTGHYVEQIQEQAKRDAKRGVYMDRAYVQMSHEQMKQYVSPGRAGEAEQMTMVIREAIQNEDPLLELIDRLLGVCSEKNQMPSRVQSAEICSEDGELLASYNPFGGGWTVRQSTAETKFLSESGAVYAQAFQAARSEMKQAQEIPSDGAPVDVRA